MIALLRTPRWMAFTILVVVVIVGFGLLSRWQWSRAQDKRLQRTALAQALSSAPLGLASALSDGYTAGDEWRAVVVDGVWQPSAQVLVRRRPLASTNGFWVMTPLLTDSGTTVWVNRGWLPATGAATTAVSAPAPAPGQVSITGYLRSFDDADPQSGLPAGQVTAASLAVLPPRPRPVAAYVQLATPPQAGLTVVPTPQVDEGQNISYAVQWLLFAAVAIGGWYFFLRREAREDAVRMSPQPGGTPPWNLT